jgi:hypothetical protein
VAATQDVVSESLSKSGCNLRGEENDSWAFACLFSSKSIVSWKEISVTVREVNESWFFSSENSFDSFISFEVHNKWESVVTDQLKDSVLSNFSSQTRVSSVVLCMNINSPCSFSLEKIFVVTVDESDSVEGKSSIFEGLVFSGIFFS